MTKHHPPHVSKALRSRAPKQQFVSNVLTLARALLLPGESEAEYSAFAERVISSVNPADVIEEILVRDVVDLTWEIQRLRLAKSGLLRVHAGKSVKPVLDAIGHSHPIARETLSQRWAAANESARKEVEMALAAAGLSIADVTAKTMEIKLDEFERLDRMLASAEARRNNALREIDRHREALGLAARRAVEEVEDAEFKDVETGVVHAISK